MIATTHAVTPTDSRLTKAVDAIVKHAPGLAEERSMRALDLALRIADNEAHHILYRCEVTLADNAHWLDTRRCQGDDHANQVERVVRYIGLRHADAFPWRFIRHPDRPELVRCEERT